MLCQHCQKRLANVHFTQTVNGKKSEMYLCQQCAGENSKIGFVSSLDMNDFLSGFIGFDNADQLIKSQPKSTVCEKCGMSLETFQKAGKLGCSNCYEVFADKLSPLLKRLHGNSEHHGKVPHRLSECMKATAEIEKLKDELNNAIKQEQYEKAAELRDKIKTLEISDCNNPEGSKM